MQSVRATSSTPLIDATVYRPGAPVAIAIVFPPILAAIGLSVAPFVGGVAIPLWSALALGGWALLAPVFWLLMKTVRVTAFGIATGRIWAEWKEITWGEISRVESRGGRLLILGADGPALSFVPRLLQNNGELRRYLTARVGPQALVRPLVQPNEADLERPAAVAERGLGVEAEAAVAVDLAIRQGVKGEIRRQRPAKMAHYADFIRGDGVESAQEPAAQEQQGETGQHRLPLVR